MKKIFTSLICILVVATTNAQYRNDDRSYPQDDKVYNSSSKNDNERWNNRRQDNRRYDESDSYSIRQRDQQIVRINREFQYRVNEIQNSRYLKNREKRNEIRRLEIERDQQLRIVYSRFDNNRIKYNERYYDKNYNWRR